VYRARARARARASARARPPATVFDRGHAASANVSSESELSSEPLTSPATRLWRAGGLPPAEKKDQGSNNVKNGTSGERAGGLHSGGPTPSNFFFPPPPPPPPPPPDPPRPGPPPPPPGAARPTARPGPEQPPRPQLRE